MDLESRRAVTPRTGVVAGSVWENRMKEVRGGIQVFNSDETPDDKTGDPSSKTELLVYKRMRAKHAPAGIGGKRKTWKTEGSEEPGKHTIQIAGQVSELEKNFDEDKCKELSGNVDDDDEIKKSPVQTPRMRSKWTKNLDEQGKELSVADIKKSPIQTQKIRSDKGCCDGIERSPRSLRTRSQKGVNVTNVGNERDSVQLRKLNSDSNNKALVENSDIKKSKDEERKDDKVLVESFTSCDYTNRRKSVELFQKSNEVVSQSIKSVDVSAITVRPVGNTTTRLDNILEVKKYKEKVVTGNSSNLSQMKSLTNLEDGDQNEYSDDDDEIETETKDLDVKIISKPEQKDGKIVTADDTIQKSNVKSIPISTNVKRQPPVVFNQPKNVPKPTRTRPIPHGDQFKTVPNKHSKLQSVVDLVMWRDPSKSAFVFGLGTFIIMSTSYTTDINLSLISVLSYVGLVYLAAIFLFRSILSRGAIDVDNTSQEYVVGEEEAVRLLKLILPYINEFLSNIKALFSGDPATTMKLAVLLYVLARCGSSITIWKMAKLGFFGVFTIPKICSSYSSQLAAYSKFWMGRFRDAWESCSHKKGVGFIVFTVVWNFSSIVARIWAVFMLFVAFRYYQQQHSEERIEVESRDASVDIRKI